MKEFILVEPPNPESDDDCFGCIFIDPENDNACIMSEHLPSCVQSTKIYKRSLKYKLFKL